MEITRIQAGSSDGLDTHLTTYFRKIWRESGFHGRLGLEIVDPFARNCPHGTITNDLDVETEATYNMDALDFLDKLADSGTRADLVIFDPPFSGRQAERYEVGHQNVYSTPGYISKCMNAIDHLLVDGGHLLKFGYNSTRHKPNWECLRIWLAHFGGNRNDVIVSLWRKAPTLGRWLEKAGASSSDISEDTDSMPRRLPKGESS